MILTPTLRRQALVVLTAGSLVAGLVADGSAQATAATPCDVRVKNLSLDSKQRFAGGSVLRRYSASVDYPVGTTYDQKSKVLLGALPSNAFPTTINPKIGNRTKTGEMVKAQEPQAVAAINGDFFARPTIRGKTNEIPRGAMIKNGRVLRADRNRTHVVGVDTNRNPFGGWFGVRGTISSGNAPGVDIQGINWQRVQGGGVTIYTTDWQNSSNTPRPAGAAEWVISGRDKIKAIRTSTHNAGQLGAPVASNTRVLAFSESHSLVAAAGNIDAKVDVNVRQSTDSGVKLEAAIGRGLALVEAGVAAPKGCDAYSVSKAARPRTMIGWTKTGAWRTFTVPGKLFTGPGLRSGGLGLANEAIVAKKLGLWYAYELDGGGSTTLYTRNGSGKWSRRDLYGLDTSTGTYEREVINGFAFVVP